MALNCPVCKAENAVGPACRRCKADLRMLFALEEERAWLLAVTGRAFAAGGIDEALRFATAADELRRGPDSQHWLAMLNLLTERFEEAWPAYQFTSSHG